MNESMNESIRHKGVCRTALVTPSLLTTLSAMLAFVVLTRSKSPPNIWLSYTSPGAISFYLLQRHMNWTQFKDFKIVQLV